MSRWTPGKPLEQSMQVNVPFSRKDGHKVGNGKAAGKSLTQAVKEAQEAERGSKSALEEMRGLARETRDMLLETRARTRRMAWTFWTLAAVVLASIYGVALWLRAPLC